ncbi:DDE-type integrase/transposase/recombinase [Leptolyngbya sp. NIES-2104]|uniref:DDE-type integrase/transposase/recombinase n=1 Tax=Leptolyngbya sp. NIES-2104 TaxID=1552121 RepID=UPI0006EC855D|nr:DDE-type integrase/transposase/recombinase [Leptolyngbya sp. NIES-2104]GAP99938.1 transposase, putative [Leptolyngbya sp. NIES-2104]
MTHTIADDLDWSERHWQRNHLNRTELDMRDVVVGLRENAISWVRLYVTVQCVNGRTRSTAWVTTARLGTVVILYPSIMGVMKRFRDRRQQAQQWYSATDLAGLLGLPTAPHNVTRKAKLEGWQSRPRQGRGGGNEYALSSLPAITQTALAESNDQKEQNSATSYPISTAQSSRFGLRPETTISDRTDAWLAILRLYETEFNPARSKTKLEQDVAFVDAYNQQQLDLPDWVYAVLPKLSRSSLKAKQKLRRTADQITALGGKYGHRRGTGRIDADSDLQAAIKTCLAAGGKHWGASQIYEILQLEFGLDPGEISLGQLRDWLRRFRLKRPQEWALFMAPDRAKGLVSPAFGSRSQSVFYPNHVWELDSMRVDINCKTEVAGTVQLTRAFVIACVDVFTRRVMLHVTHHSDAEAVCLLIASAILKWGVPDHIRTDHGKEYLSRRVQRFLANLRVETEDLRCLPGHPEQKPFVERFNRTFQHRDLVKNPFFVGRSVSVAFGTAKLLVKRYDRQRIVLPLNSQCRSTNSSAGAISGALSMNNVHTDDPELDLKANLRSKCWQKQRVKVGHSAPSKIRVNSISS